MNTTEINKSSMWMELSDGRESDWRTCFKICQRAFQNDPLYKFTHPDPELRKQFLEAYFAYMYPAIFKGDLGLLVTIKEKNENGTNIIGGLAVTLDQDQELERDHSTLLAVDEEGWLKHKRRDEWECEAYYDKLETLAERLGTTVMHGVFQMIDDGYRGRGIGKRFVMKGVQMLSDEILRRKRLSGEINPKPPLAICTCDHERAQNFTRNCGFVEIAKVQANNPEVSGIQSSCVWLFLLPPSDPTWVDIIRKEFSYTYTSKL